MLQTFYTTNEDSKLYSLLQQQATIFQLWKYDYRISNDNTEIMLINPLYDQDLTFIENISDNTKKQQLIHDFAILDSLFTHKKEIALNMFVATIEFNNLPEPIIPYFDRTQTELQKYLTNNILYSNDITREQIKKSLIKTVEIYSCSFILRKTTNTNYYNLNIFLDSHYNIQLKNPVIDFINSAKSGKLNSYSDEEYNNLLQKIKNVSYFMVDNSNMPLWLIVKNSITSNTYDKLKTHILELYDENLIVNIQDPFIIFDKWSNFKCSNFKYYRKLWGDKQ